MARPKKKIIGEEEINEIGYMVLVSGSGEPRHVHTSHKSAIDEAHRLADRHPNRLVRVLQITDQYEGKVTPLLIPLNFPIELDIPF